MTVYYVFAIISTYILLEDYIRYTPGNWFELIGYVLISTLIFAALFISLFFAFSSNFRNGVKRVCNR